MRKFLLTTLSLALLPISVTARTLLETAVAKITEAPSVSTRFEVSDFSGKVTGEAVIAGNRFVIVTDGGEYETWFDGKTQWTYNAAAGEVSMTEPTQQEILEVNPLSIISDIENNYKISPADNGKNDLNKFELTPIKKNTGLRKAVITIDRTTQWPVEILATLSDNGILDIKFLDTTAGPGVPADSFRYRAAYHPDAEIIDLR